MRLCLRHAGAAAVGCRRSENDHLDQWRRAILSHEIATLRREIIRTTRQASQNSCVERAVIKSSDRMDALIVSKRLPLAESLKHALQREPFVALSELCVTLESAAGSGRQVCGYGVAVNFARQGAEDLIEKGVKASLRWSRAPTQHHRCHHGARLTSVRVAGRASARQRDSSAPAAQP
jgi:hypothetical protein